MFKLRKFERFHPLDRKIRYLWVMEISVEFFLPFIILSGAVILCMFCLFFALFGQIKTSKWILLVFAGIGMYAFGVIMYTSKGISTDILIPSGTNPVAFFLIPVGLYFFLLDIFGKKLKPIIRLLHFTPFVIFYIIFTFIQAPEPPHIARKTGNVLMLFYIITLLLTILTYLFFILKLLRSHQKDYVNQFASDSIFITLNWFKALIFFVIGMAVFFVVSSLFDFNENTTSILLGVKAFAFLFMLMAFAFFGLQQPILYTIDEKNDTQNPISDTSNSMSVSDPSEAKKQIPKERLQQYIDVLENEIHTNRSFLNKQIRLSHLANTLDIPNHILSLSINQHYGVNFFQFINSYRIRFACDLLTNPNYDHFTLEAIAEKAGFNSKSTFNTRFKEVMKMTPNEFKKKKS